MTPERRRLLRHRHLSGGLVVAIQRCELCNKAIHPCQAYSSDGQTFCYNCYVQTYPLCDFCLTETHYTDLTTVGAYQVCPSCARRDETEGRSG